MDEIDVAIEEKLRLEQEKEKAALKGKGKEPERPKSGEPKKRDSKPDVSVFKETKAKGSTDDVSILDWGLTGLKNLAKSDSDKKDAPKKETKQERIRREKEEAIEEEYIQGVLRNRKGSKPATKAGKDPGPGEDGTF